MRFTIDEQLQVRRQHQRSRAIFWVLLCLGLAWSTPAPIASQEPQPTPSPTISVTAPEISPLGQWVPITLTAPDDAKNTLIRVLHVGPGRDRDVTQGGALPNLIRIEPGRYAFTAPLVGKFAVEAYVVTDADILQAEAQFEIAGEIEPPPDPDDDPVDAAPFPSPDGLRVLILEESADRATLTESRIEIITGERTRKWLNENTVKDGDVAGFRIWDDDYSAAQMDKVSATWRQAYAAAHAAAKKDGESLPWLVAANGSRGYSGPLPEDADRFLSIMERLK